MILVFVLGGIFLLGLWVAAVLDWRRMVYGLLLLAPFTGIPILLSGHNPVALVLKDLLFIAPLYFSLFLIHPREVKAAHVPSLVILALALLAAIVLLQCLNPGVTVMMAALIGTKVWLLYVPLVFVMGAMVRNQEDHVRLLRLMLVLAVIPCAVGLVQWFFAVTAGYRETMQAFYGRAAEEATQGYAEFDYGGSYFRIPSTFSFVAQYYGFLQSMLVVSHVAWKTDPSFKWRQFAKLVFFTVMISSFLCGQRGAYIFVPMLIVAFYLLDGRLKGMVAVIVMVPLLVFGALDMGGVDPLQVLSDTHELTGRYGEEIALGSPVQALGKVPLGIGTGANTNAARYAFPGQQIPGGTLGFNNESYYTKAIIELGVPGLLVVVGLFAALIAAGFQARSRARLPSIKTAAAAYTAFAIVIAIQNLKGWSIDLDPINVYLWIFAGILFKLPYLEAVPLRQPQRLPLPPHMARGMPRLVGRPTLARRPVPGRLR
jgi:hypothetical protein